MLPAVFLFLFAASAPAAQTSQAELEKLVSTYELTMPRIEGFGGVAAGLADWAKKDPKAAKALVSRTPQGMSSIEAAAAVFEKEPAVKTLLDKHKITGKDFALVPIVVMQIQLVALGESQGRTMPPGPYNPKNVAVVKANGPAIDAIMTKARADMARLPR